MIQKKIIIHWYSENDQFKFFINQVRYLNGRCGTHLTGWLCYILFPNPLPFFWRRSLPTSRFACLPACLSVCPFQLASEEVSQVFQVGFWCRKRQIWSTHRVYWDGNLNSATLKPFSLAEQWHTQKFYLRCYKSDFDTVKGKFGLLIE